MIDRLLPDPGPGRALCVQSGVYAVGSGVFLTGNAVFFTLVLGLTPQEVGTGLAIAGAISFAVTVPLGTLADRIGTLRSWQLAAMLEAAAYLAYPFLHGFGAFLAAVTWIAVVSAWGGAGRSAYGLDILEPATRVRTLAFMRTYLNVGFTAGALLGGVALGIGTREAAMAMPLIAGLVMVANALFLRSLPHPPMRSHDALRRSPFAAIRDGRFALLALVNGLFASHGVLLMTVLPLYLVASTSAPKTLLGWLFALNTVMAVSLQVMATRGTDSVVGSAQRQRWCGLALAVGCVAAFLAAGASAWAAAGALTLAVVFLTAAELWQSAAGWSLLAELAPPERRAEYSGVWSLGTKVPVIIGPAGFTWLAVTWRPAGWLIIAMIFAVLGFAAPTLTRWCAAGHVPVQALPATSPEG